MSDSASDAHTPVTLVNFFANLFQMKKDASLIWLKGVYHDRGRKSYGGYYYDRLKDELVGLPITLKLPGRIKSTLRSGDLYLFKGTLDKDLRRDGVVEPVFIVTELVGPVASGLPENVEGRADIQRQKSDQGYRDLDWLIKQKLYAGERPRIAMLCGATSIVLEDVTSALKEASAYYELAEHRTNLSDAEKIIAMLARLNSERHEAVAVVRGGGPGLEIFDDVVIAKAALELEPVLVTAIGHAQDVTLLQQIADKKFTTPTALGTYLWEMASRVQEEQVHSKARLIEDLEKGHQGQLRASRMLWAALAVGLLIVGFVLGLVLSGAIM